MKAKDVMTTQVTTVTLDTPVHTVAQLMLEQGVSGLPVVDGKGLLRGMVSEGDLMRRAETGTDKHKRSWWLRLVSDEEDDARDYIKTHGATAADVMTHPIITVEPETDLSEVAFTLEKRRIKRVPVAKDGKLLGLVSRADLLRALAVAAPIHSESHMDDRSIRDALVKHLDAQPWSSAAINVIVNDGVVSLWGVYDSDEQREAYLVAARNAPGAKDVEDHMMRELNL